MFVFYNWPFYMCVLCNEYRLHYFFTLIPGSIFSNFALLYNTGHVVLCMHRALKFALDCWLQALPYVALLIGMLFFIYAIIGMQVTLLLSYTEVDARCDTLATVVADLSVELSQQHYSDWFTDS